MNTLSRFAIAAFVASALGSAAVSSQTPAMPQPESMKGAVLKGRAPVSEEILRVKLPRPAEVDLANGIHLMVLEDRRVPSISLQMQILGAGGYYDPPELPGTAQVTAMMLQEGTTTRTAQQIAEELERMAATLFVSSAMGSQVATMSASGLTDQFDRTLAIAADVLLNPTFPDQELERLKTRQRAQLIQARSQPGFLASELFSRVVYGAHPAARVATTPEALAAMTRAQLVEFHEARYVPDHVVVGVAGDISMAEARKKVEAALGSWRKAGHARPQVVNPDLTAGGRVYLVDRKGSVQTNLIVGALAIDRLSSDYDVVSVMNKIVGGGPTGRLFMNLREEKGYTYGAYSGFQALRYRGQWSASTQVRSEVTNPALKELMAELTRIRTEPVPVKEFAAAKRSMVASFALSLESPTGILNNHMLRYQYGLPVDYWDRYPERIMAVTAQQAQAAAQKYLDPTRLHIVAVGDAEKIKSHLEGFGPMEAYDAEGRRIATQ